MTPLLRIFQGIRFFLDGLRMMFRYPRLLSLALIPIGLTLLVLIGVAWGSTQLVGEWLGQELGLEATGRLLLQTIALLLVLFVVYLIYLPLTRVFLAPVSEKLSRKTAEIAGVGSLAISETGIVRAIWEGIKLVALQILLVLLVLLVTLIFAPVGVPLGIFVTICFCGVDFVDVPLSVHGMTFRQKLRFLWRSRAYILGFAAMAYLLLHIPIINIFALPVGVIGATLLVNQVVSETSGDWAE